MILVLNNVAHYLYLNFIILEYFPYKSPNITTINPLNDMLMFDTVGIGELVKYMFPIIANIHRYGDEGSFTSNLELP